MMKEEGKAHLLAWAIGFGWRDGRSALSHGCSAALTTHQREDTKLAPGWAIIKAVRGCSTRRHEGGGADELN